jgi:hypothetical protein
MSTTKLDISKALRDLRRMTVKELKERYVEVFGEQSRSGNGDFLRKRIAWRLQVLAEGDITERAERRAAELADDADLRIRTPRPARAPEPSRTRTERIDLGDDRRLPPPGGIVSREYKGEEIKVKVLGRGFEYAGEVYRSLSGVAKAVTGSHWNGYHFFGLRKEGKR